MAATHGVNSVHDLHIWALSSGKIMLSAHVVIPDMAHWEDTLTALRKLILERFAIDHVTRSQGKRRLSGTKIAVNFVGPDNCAGE